MSACSRTPPRAEAAPADRAPAAAAATPVRLDDLIQRGTSAVARIPLAPETSDRFAGLEALELYRDGHVPNYIRALALIPESPVRYARAFQTILYGGTVEPETKMAMGLRIGQMLDSPYAAAHLRRILEATEAGQALVRHIETGAKARPEQDAALRYAGWLTTDVHGVDDERFRQVRGYYNDAQIVELTMTVSFFNYFTRFVQAVNVPVEPWAVDAPASVPAVDHQPYPARVGLISDAELEWAAGVAGSRNARPGTGSGLGLVNSQRAMNLVPDVTSAWRAYTGSTGRDAAVTREIELQVSFAVSMANGCRYCTLHQVLGLRRLGVSPDKLLQMRKDDGALTPRELVAVSFARQLTGNPAGLTDAGYDALRDEFGERGALEVVLQTCNFAFMNRFTDNLGLPSEDEAVRTYREVYGGDWQ